MENIIDGIKTIKEYWMLLLTIGLYLGYCRVRYDTRHNHKMTSQQRKAQNPPVGKQWLSKEPEGIVLGRVGNSWYRIPEKTRNGGGFDVGHCLVLGGSGTGKTTSVFAESLMANVKNSQEGKDHFNFVAVDIKGELHQEFLPDVIPPQEGDSEYYLIDPTDQGLSYGWDVFGALDTENLDHDSVMRIASEIASAYIQMDDKDRYFGPNAWTMLSGFVAWCVEATPRIDFVTMMQRLITDDCKAILSDVLEKAPVGSATKFFLGRFSGKGDDNESMDDIITTVTLALSPFGFESVLYMLQDNPYKLSVQDVREKSIVLVAPENALTEQELSPVYRMILNSLMRYTMEKLPEVGTLPTVFLLDELYTLGGGDKGYGLSGFGTFLSLARGYGAACVASIQSESMLIRQYGKEGAKIIEDNMTKVILQATDPDTIQSAIKWTGKFDDRNVSASEGKRVSTTVSWARKDIFDSSDISSLVAKKKVLVVPVNDKFALVTKSWWFRENIFKNLKSAIKEESYEQ